MTVTTHRDGAGYYTVTDSRVQWEGAEVTVLRNDMLTGPDKWIARAGWDRYLVTDPVPTKRDAVREATGMLNDLATGRSF